MNKTFLSYIYRNISTYVNMRSSKCINVYLNKKKKNETCTDSLSIHQQKREVDEKELTES
jgi:hypothetical protein